MKNVTYPRHGNNVIEATKLFEQRMAQNLKQRMADASDYQDDELVTLLHSLERARAERLTPSNTIGA